MTVIATLVWFLLNEDFNFYRSFLSGSTVAAQQRRGCISDFALREKYEALKIFGLCVANPPPGNPGGCNLPH